VRDRAALQLRGGRRHFQPGDLPAVSRARTLAGGVRGTFEAPEGRPLRREPKPRPAVLSVPSDSETLTADIVDLYFESLRRIGVEPKAHDLRLVEDDWESPTLGAWGLGWQVWLDGMEITQFTYFQQVGQIDLDPISVEITYGLERLAMPIQGVDDIFGIHWGGGVTWGDIYRQNEVEFSKFNFEEADVEMHFRLFGMFEKEATRLIERGLVAPGYDAVLKCSHIFNVLEARGAISVTERTGYIGRVRALARRAALAYLAQREEMGFPLLASRTATDDG